MKRKEGNTMSKTTEIKITRAGYLYINGRKHVEKITPLNIPQVYSLHVADECRKWADKNYRMS